MTTEEPSWKPVVTDPGRVAAIRDILGEIVAAVEAAPIEDHGLDPLIDRAVLRAYLAQDGAVPDPDDAAGEHLSRAIGRFGEGGQVVCLFGGAARISWAASHLADGDEVDQVCAAIAAPTLRVLEDWQGDYDLIRGVVGVGVAALERHTHADGQQVLGRVLDILERTARDVDGGAAWHTGPELLPDWQRALAPDGYYNFGLAHGMPGVVGLLARMVAYDVYAPRARALLERATGYLLRAEPYREHGRFPSWRPSDGGGSTRLAWCYGDLGASIALLSAAQATGDATWRDEALTLARLCASRKFDEAAVSDAGLCHGAGGAAHLFTRFWHATGDVRFADAARTWIDHALALRTEHPYAGFPAATRDATGPAMWAADASLLSGAIGVGLALHAAISTVEPSWDRMLLCDLALATP